MPLTRNLRAIQSIFALSAMFGIGGGCVAIYGFDDFEKNPPISCKVPKDCPGTDLCSLRVCEQGLCKRTNPVPADIFPDAQIAGDCKRIRCDGNGNDVLDNDPTDLPIDGNECTDDVCSSDGLPSNPPRTNEPCGASTMPPLFCSDSGFCTGCQAPEDCGNLNNPCALFECTDQICSRAPRNVGLIVDNAVAGDCIAIICTDTGEVKEGFAPSDAIQDDIPCTIETCKIDGSVVSSNAPDGTKCGDCQICISGACSSCNGMTSDCYNNECIPKPKTCATSDDCTIGYCVDGYCCDSECKSPCMACSNDKTGLPSGYCAPVANGTDPDNDCINPAADTCRNQSCGCENGLQDGNEAGVDCGGDCAPCTGKWNCGGMSTCAGIGTNNSCCWPVCFLCGNESTDCTALDGQTCALGAGDRTFEVGTAPDQNCLFEASVCRSVTCKCQ